MKAQRAILKQDLKAIEQAKLAIARNANKLNIFIEMAERELRTSFTTAEKINIREEGIEFINRIVKSRYHFPDASQEFNEKALGLNLKPLRAYYTSNHLLWERYYQEINKDGLFAPTDIENLPEVTRHTKYVENLKQEMALKQAKQLSRVLNKMQENGFITPYGHGAQIENVTDIVEFVVKGSEAEFAPNLHAISFLK